MFMCNFTGVTSTYSSGSVRLVGGSAAYEGRVEIWFGRRWHTVCDDSWTTDDARVACQQLGYQGAAIAHSSAHFGQGTGDIILDNLACTGTEGSLFLCPHNGLHVHNCGHSEDAGVTCKWK